MGACLPAANKSDCSTSIAKKRRNPPGNPDPDAEVVALSPKTLLATNRYVCEVCHKGFQRDQNLQLHRRGHNLPWKLKQRSSSEVKKRVYVCPEGTCPHHDPSRALGDLTGIKKHYSRKHGEKKWKCDKCSKRYAVQSDWKAHSKICGTKEYRCDCGTIFSRKDSFVTHRAFCDALAEESYKTNLVRATMVGNVHNQSQELLSQTMHTYGSSAMDTCLLIPGSDLNPNNPLNSMSLNPFMPPNSQVLFNQGMPRPPDLEISGAPSNLSGSPFISATALLQKAAVMGAKASDDCASPLLLAGLSGASRPTGSSQIVTNRDSGHNARFEEPNTVTGNGRLTKPVGGLLGESQAGMQMSSKWSSASSFRTSSSHPLLYGGDSNTVAASKREAFEEDKNTGTMTQDFLGLGSGSSRSYNDDGMFSYHQPPDAPNPFGKPSWITRNNSCFPNEKF
ncbi:hypothetical protein HPP92_022742 [Vanilla planifolia]|uniref:Protein EARLY HEADING DATE 2 n=1 Tax=Vanilla planifolia TaxID=51239 RepID=A0A835PXZ8_VANPL|nr:hypothetical protein HPP92_022742 [Vanilla planifolia]